MHIFLQVLRDEESSPHATQVRWAAGSEGDSAQAGVDYAPSGGVLLFDEGQLEATLSVPILNERAHYKNVAVTVTCLLLPQAPHVLRVPR